MTTRPARAATLAGSADETEADFYDALLHGDIERLMACWADEDDIVCVHPGGASLVGAGAIRGAFENLFAQGRLQLQVLQVRRVQALASAVHHVLEQVTLERPDGVQQAYVLATNVYHKGAQGWRLVAHHASPGTTQAPLQRVAAAPLLH